LYALGDAYFASNVTVNSNLILSNTLYALGDAYFASNVTVNSNLILSNTLYALGDAYFASNVTVNSNLILSNTLYALGDAYFSSNLTVSNTISALGDAYFASNLIVSNVLRAYGDAFFSSNIHIYGDTHLSSNLIVNGDFVFNGSNFLVNNSSIFMDKVSFCNIIHISSNVYFDPGAYIENRTYLTMSNDYIIHESGVGEIILDQQVTISELVVNNNVTFCNNALVNGVVIFGTTNSNCVAYSNVDGPAQTINKNLVVDSNLYVNGCLFVNGFRMTTIESISAELQDLVVYGSMTMCNTNVKGNLILGNSDTYVAYSNITDTNLSQVKGSALIDSNLYVGGRIFCNGFSMSAIESYDVKDLNVRGIMTLSNTQICGVISFGGNDSNFNVYSNICEPTYTEFETSVVVDSNLYVAGRIYCNGFTMSAMDSYLLRDTTITGTMTLCNTNIEGIVSFGSLNNNYLVWSNVPEPNYTEINKSLVVDSNLYVAGRIFCNGFSMTSIENYVIHDMTVYGTMTLCNTYIDGILALGSDNSNYTVWSNLPEKQYTGFDSSVIVDSNLYVGGRIFCNGFGITALESYIINDAIITGTMTLCNTDLSGIMTFGNSNNHTVWSNITDMSSIVIDNNLYVGGRIFCNGFEMSATNLFNGTYQTLNIDSNINIRNKLNFTNNSSSIWNVNLNHSNLVFTSKNNTQVIFTDNFESSVLNFTGSHTCKPNKSLKDSKKKQNLIGKIVISTGKYDNDILIDDAVPIIKLATKNHDSRCFGVISKFEGNNTERSYHIGNLKFKKNKNKSDIRVVVNGAGEGGIWVTNINGNIKNGDFITSSDIPGYGMCQMDDINKNYTVAKATCTCYFNLDSKKYKCEEFKFKGKTYKRAFIGCIYKF
jgi:hypothetical protein